MWRYPPGHQGWVAHTTGQPAPAGGGSQLRIGDHFPACQLVSLKAKQDAAYLGLPAGAKSFALREVPAPYLLVELYNEFCLLCQKETPLYNSLYQRIEADGRLKGRLRIIGMGVGSSNLQAARFRREHNLGFPIFADQNKEVFHCLGQPELPILYLLQRLPGGGFKVRFMQSGHIESPKAFLERMAEIIKHRPGT